ncbi:hypothetical protein [Bradyrhizobium sp. 160]|uniref:hypothetical protein n=1 Tax=Bradyrhizobium sp. 160 TaxID=2782634 RepID=UPI00320B7D3E
MADPPLFEGLFNRERLADVNIPILLWRSALGGDGVVPDTIDALEQLLPKRPDYRIVPNSAHFSFIAPCPPKLTEAAPILCTDPPGFRSEGVPRRLQQRGRDLFPHAFGVTEDGYDQASR